MIYVNGDSHSAGAELVESYCFAADDRRYLAWGTRAHPEAVPLTFGYKLAHVLNQPFHMDAESASSNHRILRTTQEFIEGTKNKQNLFVIIGWTTWDREEWQDPNNREVWYQITASGTDSVPRFMELEYKKWVLRQTPEEVERKKVKWQEKIDEFSKELESQGIKHLFFHTSEYTKYLREKGFKTVNNGHHFGIDAHTAWYKHLLPKIQDKFEVKTGLTETKKRSIVSSVKEQFKGFNK